MFGRNGGRQSYRGCRPSCFAALAKLEADLLAAVDQMPDDWDETELAWYLVHRAEVLTRSPDRLRRKAYEHAVRSRRL
jgi:hypothetical protein